MRDMGSRGIDRRDFVRSAVAIGGASALAACAEREQSQLETTATDTATETTTPRFPRGDQEPPSRQHAWAEYLVHDAHGNTVLPRQQVVLGLSYEGSTPPTDAERETVRTALNTLDTAFQWGTGGEPGTAFNRGLLYVLGYAPQYFERVGAEPPANVAPPEDVLDQVGEDPEKAADFDALMVLTSDLGSAVLAAEEAMFGGANEVNGISVEASLDEVFSVAERRTGFVGKGLPADKLENDDIPESAPLSMGFKSGFRDNLATEDSVTIQEGPYAGGTTWAASRLRIDLDSWYDQDHGERIDEMFCPAHDAEDVGKTGQQLGSDSGIDPEDVENIPEHAEKYNRIGHSQKTASARTDDFEPTILRRSEGFATDVASGAGFNFNSVQRTIEDFIETRKAMNIDEYDVDVPDENHGIVDFLETKSRSTFLLPPREKIALPA